MSYAEAKAQRESRLAEIFALPLHEFEETRKQLVHEAKSLRPRAGSWVHKEALVLCAMDGVVSRLRRQEVGCGQNGTCVEFRG